MKKHSSKQAKKGKTGYRVSSRVFNKRPRITFKKTG